MAAVLQQPAEDVSSAACLSFLMALVAPGCHLGRNDAGFDALAAGGMTFASLAEGVCCPKWARAGQELAGDRAAGRLAPCWPRDLPGLACHREGMRGGVPEIRLVGGRVVTAPGAGPVPMVWLPRDGLVIARIPAMKGNRRWLHETVRIRSPRLAGDRWYLPRNCLVRLVTAAVDRYGYIVVSRDMSRLSRCTRSCLEATGMDCDCSCLGAYHGQNSGGWFERVGDVVVADLGETTRTAVVYGPRNDDTTPVVYGGELSGRRYRADPAGRRGWPAASRFVCACCMSVRARVWDHCHTHGFVRAPLCNTCNTRRWAGWQPQYGRAAPSSNLDTSYYCWCPVYGHEWAASCSA
jgi:hypothetical protein